MSKQFEFADFIEEFKVSFTVFEQQPGYYSDNGKWIAAAEVSKAMQGIILPLSNDELRHEANGVYTAQDRKIYTLQPMKEGQRIEYKGDSFTIDSLKDFSDYADVYIYFAKGAS